MAVRRNDRGDTARLLNPVDASGGRRSGDNTHVNGLAGSLRGPSVNGQAGNNMPADRRVLAQPLTDTAHPQPLARRRAASGSSKTEALRLVERMREGKGGAVSALLFLLTSSPELRNALLEELSRDAETEQALACALKRVLESKSETAENIACSFNTNERFFTLGILRARLKRSSAEAVINALREAGEGTFFELAPEIRRLLKTSDVASVKLEAAKTLEKLGDKSHETIRLIEELIASGNTLEAEAKKELQAILARMKEKEDSPTSSERQ
ncbi:hypothetical protein HY992_05175 [Candidatus Micrarchaeota archaeon]|nr:hypothetical protein [Candidatus Micrarchaeota archaeon]